MTACGASFAVSSPACGLMSNTATLQPSSARRSVNPRPIPCPPPVTTATFPARPFNEALPCRLSLLLAHAARSSLNMALPVSQRTPAAFSSRDRAVLLQRKSVLRIHLPRDDRLHDLDRTSGDFYDPRIRVSPCNRIFPHIPPAAEQLQAFIHRLAVKLGGEHFCHRGVHRIELAFHEQRDAFVGKDACDRRLGPEISQLELGVLEIGNL